MPENLKLGRQFRSATFVRSEIDKDARTVPLAFSSEEPVMRWWGTEILGHKSGECDLDWMKSGRAPALVDHDPTDQVGVVVEASLDADRAGRAVVRFGKSARAEEIFNDVMDGIRTNISVGYEIHELLLVKEGDDLATYRATKWTPLELSFVSIPADRTVGVGRSADGESEPKPVPVKAGRQKEPTMENATPTPAPTPAPAAPDRAALLAGERKRIADIQYLGGRHTIEKDTVDKAIADGTSIEEFRGLVLAAIEKRGAAKMLYPDAGAIGLSNREANQFRLGAFLYAASVGKPELAAFEFEASRALTEKLTKQGIRSQGGLHLPYEVMAAPLPGLRIQDGRLMVGQRDLSTATVGAGGAFVQTDVLATDFITLLRNAMMVRAMGATVLSGLQGNVAIPRQTGAATANWVAQGGAATESDAVFSQVTLAPKTVHAIQDYTRELLLQGSLDVEGLVRLDLATVIALAIDSASLHGTGASNQPTGIAATAGIGSVAGGTNGAIPTWGNIVDLETAVAQNNAAIESVGYLSNTRVRGRLKQTPKITGYPVYIWEGAGAMDAESGFGMMNGYRAGVTNQVSNTLTKGTSTGVCSAIFFGNWRDLLIGEWGSLELLTDNITQAANRVVRVHAYQTADVGVRRAQSFAAQLDALTV
ncbi:MAG: phage major capsid protein [Tagaea sp.]|nr:phage major capsid protein [Tagaea sp.]